MPSTFGASEQIPECSATECIGLGAARAHCWHDHVSQMLTHFSRHATFVVDTKNISCVRTAHNSVAMFCHKQATSQDTMLLPQCEGWWMVPRRSRVSENFSPISESRQRFSRVWFFSCLVQKLLESRARIFKEGSRRLGFYHSPPLMCPRFARA